VVRGVLPPVIPVGTVILSEEDRPLAGDPDESKDPYELMSDCGLGILPATAPEEL
jgi:hypothetical protein